MDPTYVSDLAADPTANTSVLGIPLSAAEVTDILNRPTAGDLVQLVKYAQGHPDTWGGMYVDQRSGGIVDIALTSNDASAETAIATFPPSSVQRRFRVVQYTEAQLDATVTAVTAAIPTLLKEGIDVSEVLPDIQDNDVEIGVAVVDPTVVDALIVQFGPMVRVAKADPAVATSCTRQHCPAPWRGGLQITSYTNVYCTSGYAAAHLGSTYKYLITAGHCGHDGGSQWYQYGTLIGLVDYTAYYNNSIADAMAIGIGTGTQSNWMYYSSTETQRSMISEAGSITVGLSVCSNGYVTGLTCSLVTGTNLTRTWDGVTWTKQAQANYIANRGDSGGTAFWSSSYFGMTVATDHLGGGPSYFTPWMNTAGALDMYPCLSMSC